MPKQCGLEEPLCYEDLLEEEVNCLRQFLLTLRLPQCLVGGWGCATRTSWRRR